MEQETKSPITKNESKGNSTTKIILIVTASVIGISCFLCICCFLSFGILFRATFGSVKETLDQIDLLCDANDDQLEDAYDDIFTEGFKDATSFEEFKVFYEENQNFFGNCDRKFSEINFKDIFEGFSFNYSKKDGADVVEISFKKDKEILDIVALEEGDSWKINSLVVTPAK